ncbi:5-carboxymethyl-2-hydroxymuconate Delta-isomerase [Elizabethkingia ursingii]|jgi:5-carboxymethyl-2-hydroxymuconate isomerase|uniref:5-carboxymethyl-2-hydroxymuconate isomerase n=1 Tax=Elizabethkingia ursingii TaxID=1756150 RepID=A0AAJ3NB88_9FLAO|nr:5-carboxymethyl-2-hydroxymuconate Delta-isomerase [Elizabethkingia ursingii]MDR2229700.1 5-carboxymethyl-2-hydroxymuconate Delta-isomerase [Flavobacteriaceae bacterium]AQX09290.1 5-carboxymethyl-2-hydroxymuconate isomerase [Elizabethkingia ursingii]KUY25678.1 5-carboxymethyl-2-hydroxymuconate isomerase [Elizabethkingia ursingii]MCL1662878.1 5-carboxymethyl-2-hydroxymuconate Delta-isomerase [Elizabethkingia ursingii]MCL1670333.1 5-carboxymethyl-2-hydroxymuconate Delta-isomerase [Elizabethkin
MPNFIIDCSQDVIQQVAPDKIMNSVYEAAEETGLFAPNDIKVRIQAFQYYKLAESKKDFIHIFGYIMEGRTTEQKANLSKQIITKLAVLFPDISFLSISINDFETATYCNKSLINPDNTNHNRHFEL